MTIDKQEIWKPMLIYDNMPTPAPQTACANEKGEVRFSNSGCLDLVKPGLSDRRAGIEPGNPAR